MHRSYILVLVTLLGLAFQSLSNHNNSFFIRYSSHWRGNEIVPEKVDRPPQLLSKLWHGSTSTTSYGELGPSISKSFTIMIEWNDGYHPCLANIEMGT